MQSYSDEEDEGSGDKLEEENSDDEGDTEQKSNEQNTHPDDPPPQLLSLRNFETPISTTTAAEWQRAVESHTMVFGRRTCVKKEYSPEGGTLDDPFELAQTGQFDDWDSDKENETLFSASVRRLSDKLMALKDTITGRNNNESPDRMSKYLEAKYKWKAIDRDHQQLMMGRAVARQSRHDHSPYSVHVTLSIAVDTETEGGTNGFGRRMSNVTNLTNFVHRPC